LSYTSTRIQEAFLPTGTICSPSAISNPKKFHHPTQHYYRPVNRPHRKIPPFFACKPDRTSTYITPPLDPIMFLKTCWIVCLVLAAVSALQPETDKSSRPDYLNPASTKQLTLPQRPANRGISSGPGISLSLRNSHRKKYKSFASRKRIMKDLAAWKLSNYPDHDEVSVRWAIDVNVPGVPSQHSSDETARVIKVQLPLRIIFFNYHKRT